jgi:hypothetical protein
MSNLSHTGGQAAIATQRLSFMMHLIHRRILLATAIVFGSLIGWGGLAVAGAEPTGEKSVVPPKAALDPNGEAKKKSAVTAAQLRDALIQAAAKLVDLKVVVVERGDFTVRTEKLPVPVVFKEVWMHGRSAQVRMEIRDDDEKTQPWWTGFKSLGHPVMSGDLASVSGVKECVDMARELVFADSRLLSPGPDRKPRTLHSVSKSPHFISSLFVPLVEGDKPWILAQVRGGLTVADHISRQPLSRWRVLGEETLEGEPSVLAEIAQQEAVAVPLMRHKGELSLTQGYLAWFSKPHGLMPVRIEQTMRYGFGGKEYRLERRPDGKAPLVYVAADFVRFRDVWVPRVGSQTLYLPKEYSPTKPAAFDADELVDKLVAAGAGRFPGEREIGYRREWKVLELGPIDPSLNLWFEPQPRAEVLNTETKQRYTVPQPPGG